MKLSIPYDCAYCADVVNKIQAPKNMQCLSVTSFWTISNLISMKNSATMLILHFARNFSLKITTFSKCMEDYARFMSGIGLKFNRPK